MKIYLVAYDIADDSVREKARCVLRTGTRVQESVFEIITTSDATFGQLVQDIRRLCPEPFSSQVRWYGLNRDAFAKAGSVGGQPPSLPASSIVI